MKTFALIGAAGYVAPRHMDAIKHIGGDLVAAIDPHDSVGILDRYFPKCDFFTEFERFDRHLDKLRRAGNKVDYLVICSPNYLHDAHCRYGLRNDMDVICEKPLVINDWNIEPLRQLQTETGRRIDVVMQLRLHPNVIALKEQVDSGPKDKVYDIQLTYHTPRGNWYHHSWKGDQAKSGGIKLNIGVHFFDMLAWIFGDNTEETISHQNETSIQGKSKYQRAQVTWDLSIDQSIRKKRALLVDDIPIDFTEGFEQLHRTWYEKTVYQ
jgi:UDP-N-acetyl-2-amino-2-deoxyglucuronate dehydrogenase